MTPTGQNNSIRRGNELEDYGPAMYKMSLTFDETAFITRGMYDTKGKKSGNEQIQPPSTFGGFGDSADIQIGTGDTNYFDINLMPYFSYLPDVKVRVSSFRNNNVEPFVVAKNIFRRCKLVEDIKMLSWVSNNILS